MPNSLVARVRAAGLSTKLDEDGWPILPPTVLTIHRTHAGDEGSRQIVGRLDGVRVGEVLFGQRLSVEIAPGPHVFRVHNTLFWKTISFEALPGHTFHVTVWNRTWPGFYEYMIFIGPAPPLLGVRIGPPEGWAPREERSTHLRADAAATRIPRGR